MSEYMQWEFCLHVQGGPENEDIALQTVTLSILLKDFQFFSLLESWLNLLQDTCNIFTLKINHTVKLVKLFEDVYMSSIVLDNSLDALFSLINAVVDESLPATPIWNSWPAETRSVDWEERTFINNSIDEWKIAFHILQVKVANILKVWWKMLQVSCSKFSQLSNSEQNVKSVNN